MGEMPENCNDAAKIEYLISQGHPEHCAQRQVWGDGECECPDVAAGYNPDAWKQAKPTKPTPAPIPRSAHAIECSLSHPFGTVCTCGLGDTDKPAPAPLNPFAGAAYFDIADPFTTITDLTRRLAEVEAEKAEEYAELVKAVAMLEQAEAREKALEAILAQIGEAVGPMEEGEPCPVCHTYSHKGWCWYPALVEWDKARAARAATEAGA